MTYFATVLADSPTALWKLNEASGNFTDASGNGHSGTATGTLTYGQTSLIPSDATDKAVKVSATGSGFTFTGIACGAAAWTVEGSVTVPTLASGAYGKLFGDSSGFTGVLIKNNAGTYQFVAYNFGDNLISGSVTAGSTILFALVNSSGATKAYVNGSQIGTGTGGTSFTATNAFFDSSNAFNGGVVQGLAVWSGTALTAAQVTSHYNAWNASSGGGGSVVTSGVIGGVQCAVVVTPGSVMAEPGVGVWLVQEVSGDVNVDAGVRKVWPVTRGSVPNSFPAGCIPVEYVTVGSLPAPIAGVKQLLKVDRGGVPQ